MNAHQPVARSRRVVLPPFLIEPDPRGVLKPNNGNGKNPYSKMTPHVEYFGGGVNHSSHKPIEDKLWPDSNGYYSRWLRGEIDLSGRSKPLKGHAVLREFGFTDTPNEDHIDLETEGLHNVFDFLHLKLAQHEELHPILRLAADDLVRLVSMRLGNERTTFAQMEFWPRMKSFDDIIIYADIEQGKKGGKLPYVKLNLTVLLAIKFLLFKFAHDNSDYNTIRYNNILRKQRGEPLIKAEFLPANVPQMYIVDNKTGRIFSLSNSQLKAIFENNCAYDLKCDLNYGAQLRLSEVTNNILSGSLLLLTMKLEALSQHKDCPSDLCLDSILRTQDLLSDNYNAGFAGVAAFLNFSGYTTYKGSKIMALVVRSQRSFTKSLCPICNHINHGPPKNGHA